MAASPPKVGFVSLGCAKALVDSERILTALRAEGYAIVPRYDDADLVVVNTCGFIDAAVAESLDAIGEALAENGRVVVTGCLGERAETITKHHPGVLAITGPHATEAVMAAIHEHLPPTQDPFQALVPRQGIRLTPAHYAYLKISEGCNHHCRFCIIPSLRGPLVSRSPHEIMGEAEALVAAGVREILVISQDTSAYGVDRRYAPSPWRGEPLSADIVSLATALGTLGAWVRLHYVYPYPHVDGLLPLMAEGTILPYLDVPFQHASRRVLKAMRRPASGEDNLRRIEAWRAVCPDLTVRSTFIVGFPGETEAEFEELLDFITAAGIDRAACFAYSPVEGATANALADPVPEDVREDRRRRFMERQAVVSAARLQKRVGRIVTVVVDETNAEHSIARSGAEAPDIDGVIRVDARLAPGSRAEVRISAAGTHDLEATLVERERKATRLHVPIASGAPAAGSSR